MATVLSIKFVVVNVRFVEIDGARNIPHFAAEKTTSFLTKRRVQTLFLLDRDERNQDDIARLTTALGKNAKIYVLRRREIENYLFNPRAIAEFISLKRRLAGDAKKDHRSISEADVKQAMEETVESLKQMALDKRAAKVLCRPIHPGKDIFKDYSSVPVNDRIVTDLQKLIDALNERLQSVEKVFQDESAAVNSSWEREKFNIIPGDLLLDKVCSKFGVRYKKATDGARLAGFMRDNDIEDEIKQIIKDIGNDR